MTDPITESDLRRRTPEQVAEQIATLYAAGMTARQVLAALTEGAIATAQAGAEHANTWLFDGWNFSTPLPTNGLSPAERDRRLLAAMTAFTNAATLLAAVRTRAHITRPDGWDPLPAVD